MLAILSVTIRGGDACNIIEHQLLPPSLFQGVWDPRLRAQWSRQRRRCAHPEVYVPLLRRFVDEGIGRGVAVDQLLLATDYVDATGLLEARFPGRVVSRAFDRVQLLAPRRAPLMQQWIEFRASNLSSDVPVATLEDLRMLTHGRALVASMFSSFATLAWNLMSAHHGEEVPYASVDSCVPHLDVWPSLAGTTNDERERRGLPTFTAEVHRGGPTWSSSGGRSSAYPRYRATRGGADRRERAEG
jgi:hypothetical protein